MKIHLILDFSEDASFDLSWTVNGNSVGDVVGRLRAGVELAGCFDLPLTVEQLSVEAKGSAVLMLIPFLQRAIGFRAILERLHRELVATIFFRARTTHTQHKLVLIRGMRV